MDISKSVQENNNTNSNNNRNSNTNNNIDYRIEYLSVISDHVITSDQPDIWIYKNDQLKHKDTDKCLGPDDDLKGITMTDCDKNKFSSWHIRKI